ncbi:cell division protein FtsL [Alkalibacillus aidingensis]|uniref:cell division protein FtsL n=1 Tax=Alkalibacillus aidingensis TaxID=2747607 RepID=UPI001661078D|nr:cell division protein FtsL [Alkalibacillus aidingensis]
MALEQVRSYQVQEPKRRVEQQPIPTPKPVQKPWFTKGEKVLYTLGIVIMAITAIVVVSFSSSVDSMNRDVQNLNNEVQELQSQNTSLQAEVQELSNPNRILSIAQENGLDIRHADVKQVYTP